VAALNGHFDLSVRSRRLSEVVSGNFPVCQEIER
jgi:hypothetical protein